MSSQPKRFSVRDDSLTNSVEWKDGQSYRVHGNFLSTTDAARARDTLLTPPTDAEFAEYFARRAKTNLGRRWTGEFEAIGAAVAAVVDGIGRMKDKRAARRALDMVGAELEDWGSRFGTSEASIGPAQALTFTGQDEAVGAREEDLSGHALRSNGRAPFTITGDFSTPPSPEDMNAAAKAFWDKQPTHRAAREWGKG
jgi:hypothetical protein